MANTATQQPTHHCTVELTLTLDVRWQDGDLLDPEYLARGMVTDWADDMLDHIAEPYTFAPQPVGADEPTSTYVVRLGDEITSKAR